jgi:hypothetical protein
LLRGSSFDVEARVSAGRNAARADLSEEAHTVMRILRSTAFVALLATALALAATASASSGLATDPIGIVFAGVLRL